MDAGPIFTTTRDRLGPPRFERGDGSTSAGPRSTPRVALKLMTLNSVPETSVLPPVSNIRLGRVGVRFASRGFIVVSIG